MAKMNLEFHNDLDALSGGLVIGSSAISMAESRGLPPEVVAFLRELLEAARNEWGDDVWRIFNENKEMRILSVGWWFINFTFRVKHCGALVRLITSTDSPPVTETP